MSASDAEASLPVAPWELLSERVLFAGRRPVLERRFRLGSGIEADFEIQDHGPTVAVLALTVEDRVLVVHQFRPGPQRVLVELPGGVVDDGELPIDAARRELREETGHEADDVRFVASYPVAGFSTWYRHVFVATGCTRVGAPEPDLEEELVVSALTVSELVQVLVDGGSTEISSAMLALHAAGLLPSGAGRA